MEKTESNVVELKSGNSALAETVSSPVAGWVPPKWDEERIALARKAVTPPSATEAEFAYFIAWCKRTGLDPFVKQAFLVERRAQDARGNWISKHEPMAAESGLAARADAEADFRGIESAAVYEGDVFRIVRLPDGTQGVHHEWSPADRAKAGNKLLGAWAHAKRAGRTVKITWLPLSSRIQTTKEGRATKFWATMPEGQIEKCARAEQYRMAFPNIFGSAYVPEEMPDEEYVDGAVVSAPPSPPRVTANAELSEKLAEKLKPKTAPATSPAPTPANVTNERVLQFGPYKGVPISALEAEQLQASMIFLDEKVKSGLAKSKSDPKNTKVAEALAAVSDELAALEAERKRRVELIDASPEEVL